MATEAVTGQDRLNILIEIEALLRLGCAKTGLVPMTARCESKRQSSEAKHDPASEKGMSRSNDPSGYLAGKTDMRQLAAHLLFGSQGKSCLLSATMIPPTKTRRTAPAANVRLPLAMR